MYDHAKSWDFLIDLVSSIVSQVKYKVTYEKVHIRKFVILFKFVILCYILSFFTYFEEHRKGYFCS